MAQNFLPALPTQDVGPKVPAASGEKAEAGTPKIETVTKLSRPGAMGGRIRGLPLQACACSPARSAKAEDMVQETFLVALKAGETFAGRPSAKSWLLGYSEKQDLRLLPDRGAGNIFHRLGILFR